MYHFWYITFGIMCEQAEIEAYNPGRVRQQMKMRGTVQ